MLICLLIVQIFFPFFCSDADYALLHIRERMRPDYLRGVCYKWNFIAFSLFAFPIPHVVIYSDVWTWLVWLPVPKAFPDSCGGQNVDHWHACLRWVSLLCCKSQSHVWGIMLVSSQVQKFQVWILFNLLASQYICFQLLSRSLFMTDNSLKLWHCEASCCRIFTWENKEKQWNTIFRSQHC